MHDVYTERCRKNNYYSCKAYHDHGPMVNQLNQIRLKTKFWSTSKKFQRNQHFVENDLLLIRFYLSTALLANSRSLNPWLLNHLWTDRIASPVILGDVLHTLTYRNRKTLRVSDRTLPTKVHISAHRRHYRVASGSNSYHTIYIEIIS